VNGAAAEKPAAAPAAAQPAAATGVKLPAGVASGQSAQGSINFVSIGPAELQQHSTQPAAPAAAPPAAAAPVAAKPAAAAPPARAPQPSKPVSFAAAASGGTAPKHQAPPAGQQQQQQHQHQQQRGPGGSRAPRAVQPVAANMTQGAAFNSQPMATAFLLSPGAPVAYPQAYMLYNPSVSTQQYFAGGFGQAGQYPGFTYGSPAQGGNMPTGSHGPQPPVQSMPVPPPPPQVSSSGASSGAATHGSYGNTPSSPLPARAGTASTPPPARVRKILRIENPETHEVLNLADIAASKKAEAGGEESAPTAAAPKDQSAVDEKVNTFFFIHH
jgi:hypothetical protein